MTFMISCKSYMEYTAGIKELNYSFDNKNVKRYSSLKSALKVPANVSFLDISIANDKESEKTIQDINSNILKFPNLKKLTILGNHTSALPLNILKISSLEFLAINSFNLDKNIRIDSLKNLKFISLGDCNLKELPESILNLTSLQGIDITANEISFIPLSISKLIDLRTIDLTNNNFTEIPNSLNKCINLQYIDLNNAEGTDIVKLKSYNIGVNNIKTVTDLNEFKNLKGLYLTWAYSDIESLKLKYPNIKFN